MNTPRWYMLNKMGMATLCASKADAEQEAADAQRFWPHMGPHRAVQLVEAADVEAMRAGYAAARLEIESLQARIKTMAEEHADELMVAHLDGRMRAAQPAGAQQSGAAYAALPDADRDYMRKVVAVAVTMLFDGYKEDVMRVFSTGELSEFATITAAMRVEKVEDIYRRAWDLLSLPARASHGQAPAQAAPAAVDHDEDLLEKLYWEFDSQRKKTGEERLAFKVKMRFYASEFLRRSDGKMTFAQSVSDDMMNLADRLGSEFDDVDPRAWKHLLVYAPKAAPAAVAIPTFEDFCKRHGLDPEKMNAHGGMWARVALDECRATTQPSPAPQADSQPAPVRDYPPLPEPAGKIQFPAQPYESAWVSSMDAYDESQMYAFVDADRAARTPADSGAAPAGGADWQDISTAPKDGTRFVAVGQNYGLDSEAQHTCIAQWLAGCWVEVSDWNEASELKYLTHWMPLPPLPGSAEMRTQQTIEQQEIAQR